MANARPCSWWLSIRHLEIRLPVSGLACYPPCHPSLREGSGSTNAEILPLREARGCGSCAQDDKHYLQMSSSVCRRLQFHGVSGQSPTATQTEHLARALPAASPPLRAD